MLLVDRFPPAKYSLCYDHSALTQTCSSIAATSAVPTRALRLDGPSRPARLSIRMPIYHSCPLTPAERSMKAPTTMPVLPNLGTLEAIPGLRHMLARLRGFEPVLDASQSCLVPSESRSAFSVWPIHTSISEILRFRKFSETRISEICVFGHHAVSKRKSLKIWVPPVSFFFSIIWKSQF
jgi:hypothetical protein